MCLAVPGRIIEIDGETDVLQRSGRVDFGGIVRRVNLALLPEARVGQYVLVHVGLALSVVDEEEARQIFDALRQMEELAELPPEGPP